MAEPRRISGSDDTLSYNFHMTHNGGSCHCIHANTYMDESKCELWAAIMHQWSFTDHNKCTFTLVGTLTTMDACVGRMRLGELFVFVLKNREERKEWKEVNEDGQDPMRSNCFLVLCWLQSWVHIGDRKCPSLHARIT